MPPSILPYLDRKDFAGLRQLLALHPELANEEIPAGPVPAHPLHRICDRVFEGRFTDEEALAAARILLEHGARVDGNHPAAGRDTPLIAAASLHADLAALLYVESGADLRHPGTHGGTALHWAAWCGRPAVVERLLAAGAEPGRRCADFGAEPLFWAVHGYVQGGRQHLAACQTVVRMLRAAGADPQVPSRSGTRAQDLLGEEDAELSALLN
ncbi:MAG: ankyrin repeat domain-containing protein [Bacteroidia bacterium]|nr:ankyrin repeat domain-containing protein [Bacteroidia bacterium]